jgi:hypothetical protein
MKIWGKQISLDEYTANEEWEKNQTLQNNKMSGITTYLSILTQNVNGLNSPIRRHSIAGWSKSKT